MTKIIHIIIFNMRTIVSHPKTEFAADGGGATDLRHVYSNNCTRKALQHHSKSNTNRITKSEQSQAL